MHHCMYKVNEDVTLSQQSSQRSVHSHRQHPSWQWEHTWVNATHKGVSWTYLQGIQRLKAGNKRHASAWRRFPPSGCESPSLILYTPTVVMWLITSNVLQLSSGKLTTAWFDFNIVANYSDNLPQKLIFKHMGMLTSAFLLLTFVTMIIGNATCLTPLALRKIAWKDSAKV